MGRKTNKLSRFKYIPLQLNCGIQSFKNEVDMMHSKSEKRANGNGNRRRRNIRKRQRSASPALSEPRRNRSVNRG